MRKIRRLRSPTRATHLARGATPLEEPAAVQRKFGIAGARGPMQRHPSQTLASRAPPKSSCPRCNPEAQTVRQMPPQTKAPNLRGFLEVVVQQPFLRGQAREATLVDFCRLQNRQPAEQGCMTNALILPLEIDPRCRQTVFEPRFAGQPQHGPHTGLAIRRRDAHPMRAMLLRHDEHNHDTRRGGPRTTLGPMPTAGGSSGGGSCVHRPPLEHTCAKIPQPKSRSNEGGIVFYV